MLLKYHSSMLAWDQAWDYEKSTFIIMYFRINRFKECPLKLNAEREREGGGEGGGERCKEHKGHDKFSVLVLDSFEKISTGL